MKVRIRHVRWLIALLVATALSLPTAALASVKLMDVPCQVWHNVVSMNITSDGTVAYGVLDLSATQDTVTLGDTQTVVNTSNETEAVDFYIKSSDAVGGSQSWTLVGAGPGAEEFTHWASIDGGSNWDITMTTTNTYVLLKANVAASSNQTFDLQIGMPTSTTDYYQHTITVTIGAAATGTGPP